MINIIFCLIFFLFGVLLRVGKCDWLISGYNFLSEKEKNKYDKLKLLKFFSNLMFFFGAIIFLNFICSVYLTSYYNQFINRVFFILIVLVVFACLIYANKGNRFLK